MILLKTVSDANTGEMWDEWVIRPAQSIHKMIEDGNNHA